MFNKILKPNNFQQKQQKMISERERTNEETKKKGTQARKTCQMICEIK